MGFKLLTVLSDTKIRALHRSLRRREHSAASVFELFAWLQQGLMAYHAQPSHFLYAIVGIDNGPVARNQLSRYLTGVFDRDGVREYVVEAIRIRLFR
jgi:hypothetical protein